MKGLFSLVLFQALLSTISGVLMAQMSLVGKVSIWLVYRDYGLLRVWWKAALLVFGVQLVLIFLLWIGRQLLPAIASRISALLFLFAGWAGAYWTYLDFTTTSHRLLKNEFHWGGYLVWVAWTVTCLYFLFAKRRRAVQAGAVALSHGSPGSMDRTDELGERGPSASGERDGLGVGARDQ